MSNRQVLLLNRGESLVDVIDWHDAVCLLVKGNAIAPFGYDDYYKIPISEFSAEKMQKSGTFKVEIEDAISIKRPSSQGGLWFLAEKMKVVGPV